MNESKHMLRWTRWESHHNTFTRSLHLVPFSCHLHKYALCLLVVCREVLWKAVGSVVVGVHVDVHGKCMGYVVGGCNVVAILSMPDMICLACMQKL